MPPARTPKASTSARTVDKQRKPGANKGNSSQGHEHVPGVQKIKSAIRQTTRLLAKDTVAADKRVEAERRLAALQSELALAETARVERNMASKYHMVKFFERRKIERRIVQAKKAGNEDELFERRVDLNYILHYPRTEKYVALLKEGDSARRAELRARIAELMHADQMDAEPELAHAKTSALLGDHKDTPRAKVAKTESKGEKSVKGDAFFGSDEERDEEGKESSSSDSE